MRGVTLFNAGQFFAAHETWEATWVECVGPEKALLQGLIEIAAGYAKIESGIRNGGVKLLTRGLDHLRAYLPMAHGLDLGPFAAGVEADLQRVRAAPQTAIGLALVRPPVLRRAEGTFS